MSEKESTLNFSVKEWNDAIVYAREVGVAAIYNLVNRYFHDLYAYRASWFRTLFLSPPLAQEFSITFASNFLLPKGTYPLLEGFTGTETRLFVHMSPDVFAYFKMAPTLHMHKLAHGIVYDYNESPFGNKTVKLGVEYVNEYLSHCASCNGHSSTDAFTIQVGIWSYQQLRTFIPK